MSRSPRFPLPYAIGILLLAVGCLGATGATGASDSGAKPSSPERKGSPQSSATLAPSAPAPALGFDAPLLEVDRFSDEAGTRLRRSRLKGLPEPNHPIHLDDSPFLVSLKGPGGEELRCYDLDVRPDKPAKFFVFYDSTGSYVLTQFPVVEVAPGDPGYSDLWDIWKVTVPDDFKADNSVRDGETLARLLSDPRSGYTAERTGALLNGPIVPEGSTARLKADRREGSATLRYAWYRGRRAPFLYFEEHLRLEGGKAPVAPMILDSPPPPEEFLTLPLSQAGQLRVTAFPGAKDYSPLFATVDPTGKSLASWTVNCPIVGR